MARVEKKCRLCLKQKPLEKFDWAPWSRPGRYRECKICRSSAVAGKLSNGRPQVSDENFQNAYRLMFEERRGQREVARILGMGRETLRRIHREIRNYIALGEIHPRLKEIT